MTVFSALGILFGLVMAFGSTSIIFQSYNRAVAQAFWNQSQLHDAVVHYHSWIFVVLGTSIWLVSLLSLSCNLSL
jgi:hypothetical protein